MKFATVTFWVLAALFSSSEACKCVSSFGNNVPATHACCREAGGTAGGEDCPAREISNHLSRFATCCRDYSTRSDCRCPFGCALKELEAENKADGKEPPTQDEALDYLHSYGG